MLIFILILIKINATKTKLMMISNEENKTLFELGNEEIEKVGTIEYLGTILERIGSVEEVNNRIIILLSNITRFYQNNLLS